MILQFLERRGPRRNPSSSLAGISAGKAHDLPGQTLPACTFRMVVNITLSTLLVKLLGGVGAVLAVRTHSFLLSRTGTSFAQPIQSRLFRGGPHCAGHMITPFAISANKLCCIRRAN